MSESDQRYTHQHIRQIKYYQKQRKLKMQTGAHKFEQEIRHCKNSISNQGLWFCNKVHAQKISESDKRQYTNVLYKCNNNQSKESLKCKLQFVGLNKKCDVTDTQF